MKWKGHLRLRGEQGFTLVELMISLLLGLIVVGAAGAVFRANQQTYRTTDELARIQENARVAFELLAKDIREAGGNPCGNGMNNLFRIAPTNAEMDAFQARYGLKKNEVTSAMWNSMASAPQPPVGVRGTQSALTLSNGFTQSATVNGASTNYQSANLDYTGSLGVSKGETVIVCDPLHATEFVVTNSTRSGNGGNLQHNSGNNGNGANDRQNITKCLGHFASERNGHCMYKFGCAGGDLATVPAACTDLTREKFPNVCKSETNKGCKYGTWPAYIVKFQDIVWTVAPSAVDSSRNALFRNGEEVAIGVDHMEVAYLAQGATSYVSEINTGGGAASGIVKSVRVTLSLDSAAAVGIDEDDKATKLEREVEFVVSVRNAAG